MNTPTSNETEFLVHYSRRGLWVMLVLFLMLGTAAAMSLAFPGSDAFGRLAIPLPIFIVAALAGLKSSAMRARTNPAGPAMKAVLDDELRQDSLKRAYRNGFFAVMIVQPLLAWAPSLFTLAYPAPLAACITATIGAVVVTASLLYYDR